MVPPKNTGGCMRTVQQIVALLVCSALIHVALAAENQVGYTVKYSGGSLPNVKSGEDLRLFIENGKIRLRTKRGDATVIPTAAVTEISYGQEVHRRVGTAVGLAVISLGIGALTALSKSKKHYIGMTWADGENKGGIALQADKNEYRGVIAALEGVTGKKAIDTDAPTEAAAKSGLAQPVPSPNPPTITVPPPQAEPPQVIPVTTTPTVRTASRVDPSQNVLAATAPTQAASAQAEPIRVTSAMPAATVPVSNRQVDTSGLVDVTFASNPPGAVVYFSGMLFRATPFVTKLQPGKYPIKMTLAGYPDWEAEIAVDSGKPATVVAQLNSTTGVVLK
jgi:hypothetical protein